MRRVGLMIALAFCGLTWMVSIGETGGEKKAGKESKVTGFLPQGWKNLDLSAEQKEKIYKMQAQFKAKYQALEDQVKELKTQEKKELVSVLTEAQKKELAKILLGEGSK